MKIAVIADIHSNLEALTAALQTIDERRVDAIYCLGDVVGYGADPAACVDLVRERCTGTVLGNHDLAVATGQDLDYLPRDGQTAALHNRAALNDEQIAWLAGLPLRATGYGCTFVHASPEEPARWLRLEGYQLLMRQFEHFDTDVCFVGHTHLPAFMANRIGVLKVRPGHRYLVNPGSVGQPRDGNPRLGLAFFDTEAFSLDLVRVPYNTDRAAARIEAEGLPASLSRRLKRGQ